MAGDGSYAGAPWPNPWRPVAPVAVAPTSLSPSFFFNNFMVQFEVSPLHELDLGDLWLDFSICCYQKVVTSKMQQVRIRAILPGVTLVGSCGLSIPYLLMRWSTWSTSNILDIIVLLEAIRWCQDCSLIDQISAVTTSLLMISYKWYAKLNFLHVFILEIMDVSFQHVDFAARWCECLNWNNLPSVNLWCQVNFTVTDLLDYYVRTQYMNFISSKNLGFGILWLRIDIKADPIILELMASTTTIHEQHFLCCLSCTCLSLSKDRHVEDAVSMLFGLFHRRWTTTPPLLIPRFNGRDIVSLSSVKAIRHLQLISTPRVHIPDRPLGEPPTGHQLDRTSIEAIGDCRCGNFESVLSADERTPYGSICDLQHLLREFRSPSSCVVHLGTYFSCSTVESLVMLYHDL